MKWGFAALVGAVAVLGAGVPDRAAAEPFAARWTGFYLGGNAGGAWSKAKTESPLDLSGCAVFVCFIASVVADINAQSARTLSSSTFTGGVQAGYNFQSGHWVLGGEVDFGAFRMNEASTIDAFYSCCAPPAFTSNRYTNSVSTDWLFTARGKLGFAAADWLIYGTGGLAVTRASYAHTFIEGSAGTTMESASVSGTMTGYAVGGGLEYGWDRNWSLRAEYLHLDFGSISTEPSQLRDPVQTRYGHLFHHTMSLTADLLRLGLNYKFN